jgi:hypothetical protein
LIRLPHRLQRDSIRGFAIAPRHARHLRDTICRFGCRALRIDVQSRPIEQVENEFAAAIDHATLRLYLRVARRVTVPLQHFAELGHRDPVVRLQFDIG